MKRTDLAYYAGLFDGEGCVQLRPHKRSGKTWALYVSIASTNEWIIQQLKFSFGGSLSKKKWKNPNWKPAFIWGVSSKDALTFLEAVYPYLKLKKPQAEIAIRFQKHKIIGAEIAIRFQKHKIIGAEIAIRFQKHKIIGCAHKPEYFDIERELREAVTRLNQRGMANGNKSKI